MKITVIKKDGSKIEFTELDPKSGIRGGYTISDGFLLIYHNPVAPDYRAGKLSWFNLTEVDEILIDREIDQ